MKLDALPLELCLMIARKLAMSSATDPSSLIRLSSTSSQMRNLLTQTQELWTRPVLSGSESSHKLARLFMARSGIQALSLSINLPEKKLTKKKVQSFLKSFTEAAPRIADLSVRISHPFSLELMNTLLGKVNLPQLTGLDLDYDNVDHEGFDRYITLPSNGAQLHSLSLSGVQTQPYGNFSFDDLAYFYLGAGEPWKWMSMSIESFLPLATSLQELHFVGKKGMFRTSMDDGFEDVPIVLPALRSVNFVNVAAGFVASFLREVNAPILERVDITTPPHRTHDEDGEHIFIGWPGAAGSIMRKPSYALPAKTLKLCHGPDGAARYTPEQLIGFTLFLVAIFPALSRLEMDADYCSILQLCENFARRNRPFAWAQKIEEVKVCEHFGTGWEAELEDAVKYLSLRLGGLKEQGVMDIIRLELSVDRSLRPPVGTVSLEPLQKIVGEIVLTD
ncbi:hypothetical protein FRB90_010952 [Tulasnella sp. 427]|nr:hypothetical protein FRB90_010952 [Tulasnella sp. 427]